MSEIQDEAYAKACQEIERPREIVLATGYGPGPDDPDFRLRQAHAFWYQWWFHTPGSRLALEQNRERVCEYPWRVWSPQWRFQPDEFAAVAASFENDQSLIRWPRNVPV